MVIVLAMGGGKTLGRLNSRLMVFGTGCGITGLRRIIQNRLVTGG